ncbi:MAG: hypothetical protein IT577_11135 [Verrucomicrobiae bacterium]|nr:hypothetical protein [Verrucomicrobiae bacterium]
MAIAIKNAAQNAQNARNENWTAEEEAGNPNSNRDPNQDRNDHFQTPMTTGGQLIEQGIRTIPNGVGLPTTIKVLTTGSSVNPGKKKGNGSGQGNCPDDVRDNVRTTAQDNVRDTVTSTVKDGVKDGVKDSVTTTVKDTCADGCKDTVKSNTRDSVRSGARDCGGGANCR